MVPEKPIIQSNLRVSRKRRFFEPHPTRGTRLERDPRVSRVERLLSSAKHVAMPQNASLAFSKTASL